MQVNSLQKYDSNALSGYGSALMFRNPDAKENPNGLYSILIPLETLPSVFGSVDSFEYDLLTSQVKGKVEGKESLEQTDLEFLWIRDNVKRLEALQGQIIDFLVVYQDYTARSFSATIKVRPNEASAEIVRGTMTITPMTASTTTILDCRDMLMDTITFVTEIPVFVTLEGATGTKAIVVETGEEDVAIATTVTLPNGGTTTTVTAQVAQVSGSKTKHTLTLTGVGGNANDYALVTIKGSKTGYASWEKTIAVNFKI